MVAWRPTRRLRSLGGAGPQRARHTIGSDRPNLPQSTRLPLHGRAELWPARLAARSGPVEYRAEHDQQPAPAERGGSMPRGPNGRGAPDDDAAIRAGVAQSVWR